MSTLDDPFAELVGPLAGTSRWQLEVVGTADLTPHMRRVRLRSPGLGALEHRPGQDLMLMVDVAGRTPVRRRYTIRGLDRATDTVTVDVVLHGDGPGERWIRSARAGATIEAIAPRGKVFPAADADWHLFVGDEAALPATAAMVESLPAGVEAIVLLEIPETADEQPIETAASLRLCWLPRDGAPPGEPDRLLAAVRDVDLPAGHGHAYVAGEAKVVLALRELLAERGVAPEQVSPKAYWGRGRSNANHGEPARS